MQLEPIYDLVSTKTLHNVFKNLKLTDMIYEIHES